ncbi:carbohydrate binding domain-containing protein [Paenibacillus dokdonensis]|uniref:carbohydrate binding domain-containing protein n=1 Tax=Paenibacillus dokdonensis TaxID=2567944 RepID=UPI0010A8D576|nr:carbohydrate binding domain-containing protein [Paenibacillus dokdonensis]
MTRTIRRYMIGCFIAALIGGGLNAGGSSASAQAANVLSNPGFEQVYQEEEAVNWSVFTNQSERPGIVHDAGLVYAGDKAAYIVPSSSLTYNLTGLKANTGYTFTAYVKLSDASASAKLGAKWYDGSKLDIVQDVTGADYAAYTVSFTTGNQTTSQVFLWSSNGLSGKQKAYIDNVAVRETGAASGTNLIANPGFEQTTGDLRPVNWRVWPSQGEIPQTVTDKPLVYAGNRAGFIPSTGSLNYDLSGLKTNTTYKFSAYVKTSAPGAGAILGVKTGAEEIKLPVTGTEYAQHEIVFHTGNQTTATVYLWSGGLLGTNQKAYIDAAEVTEYAGAAGVNVSLNMKDLQLANGDQYELLANVAPADAPDREVTFTSTNPTVAVVDSKGVITAKGPGTADIKVTAHAGGNEAVCHVTVTAAKKPWYPDNGNTAWVLTKEDNFNGTELDTNLWSVRGKEYATYHRDDMVSVSDGKLKLQIAREPDGNVVLGRVDTHGEDRQTNEAKFDQKYGFFEVSAKIPPTEKTYFAFWAFNYPGVFNIDGTGKDGLEIDVTETVWKGDYTETALHWDGYDQDHQSTGSGKKPAPNIHDGFHVYGLEWSEDALKFYFDGKLTWTYTNKANIPWVKEIFILSSGWARSPGWGEGNIDNAQLPYFSEVDWFRAYQKADPNPLPDTTAPVLYGVKDIQIPLNTSLDLLEKVYALDNRDDREEITGRIQLDETGLDRSQKGDYQVTYTVLDAAGNRATRTRRVTVTDPVENLISNGGFNQGNLDGWEQTPGKAAIKQTIDHGRYASVLAGGKIQQSIAVKPNTEYEVTLSAKTDRKSDVSRLLVGVTQGGQQTEETIAKSEWSSYTFHFTTGSGVHSAVFYMDNPGPENASIDAIRIAEKKS